MTEQILRMRMHGLYLSRGCVDIAQLSRELMGLHCWFHRNVAFSALIRGADLMGWKHALTKTWLYRGTLHGVAPDDLPDLLALHAETLPQWLMESCRMDENRLEDIAEQVIRLMEDGVYSRAEMRKIFSYDMPPRTIDGIFSPWGGIFVHLARRGRVAFRDMTSRDFDLIDAEPTITGQQALPLLLRRYFAAYGPATLEDAAWFLGLWREGKKRLAELDLSEFSRIEHDKKTYYYAKNSSQMADIPRLTLLSGFDPIIVSYTDRGHILPPEYKSAVILKSGICLPTIAVDGKIAGLWNIKGNKPVVEFFASQPKRVKDDAMDMAENIRLRTSGLI